MSLKKLGGHTVYGIDRDPETVRKAIESGVVAAGSCDADEYLPIADLTVLCLYPDAVRPFLESYGSDIRPGSILTDTTGVKEQILRSAGDLFPQQADFILGHPMAGREKRGLIMPVPRFSRGRTIFLPRWNKTDRKIWI